MTKLAFVDTETTGLDPDLHEIWEVALILREENGSETEHVWQLPVDLGRADPIALKIGRFMERRWQGEGTNIVIPTQAWADYFSRLTWGCHLVGAVVSFDAERLRKLLRANGACEGWHYHLVDVEAMCAGYLGEAPPWDSTLLTHKLGLDPDRYEKHTALGDACWARDLYDKVLEGRGS